VAVDFLCEFDFPTAAAMARKSGASLSLGAGFSTSGGFANAKNLPWLAVHYALALLPVAWLFWTKQRLAKVRVPS